jgi:Uma2 family endonuclease
VLDPRDLAPERIRPLRRVEFDRLVELGRFEDERVELLFGALVEMTPPGPPHATVVDRLTRMLVRALGDRAWVRVQNPLALTEDSEPEPDLALVPPGDYAEAHPDRAYLVIEVADASLNKDRRIKASLYASAGIPAYWIVNLRDRVIEVHEAPANGAYQRVGRHAHGEVLSLPAFPDLAIPVDDVLGR